MSLGSIVDKFKAFGWNVIEIDGHDFDQIFAALDIAKSTVKKPTMIVAKNYKRQRNIFYGKSSRMAWDSSK